MKPSKTIDNVPEMINVVSSNLDVARNPDLKASMAERQLTAAIAQAQATMALTMAVMEVNTTLREMKKSANPTPEETT